MGITDQLTCLLRNLYPGQEATVRTGHGTTDWFQIRKELDMEPWTDSKLGKNLNIYTYIYILSSNRENLNYFFQIRMPFIIILKIILFIFDCVALCCCVGFSLVAVSGGSPGCGTWASPCRGFSCCGARAPGTRAHYLQ